jgi:type III secretion protein D
MYELRVLSGWHRGASLPLAGGPHLIGTGHDCDLMLSDACIAARHASLWPTKYGWLLTVADGAIHAVGSNLPQSAIDLKPGDFVRVADVWLAIVATEAAWEEPPLADAQPAAQPEATALTGRLPAVPAPAGGATPTLQDAKPDCAAGHRWSERKILLIQLAAAVVIFAVACAMVFKSPVATGETAAHDATWITTDSGAQAGGDIRAAGKRGGNAAGVPAAALSPHQLRQAFRSRLADAGLMKRFELTLGDRSWLMHAVLDDEETQRFERVLVGFLREYHVSFPVNAKIVRADTTLPFKIQQIVSGANASLVMQDGRRIRVGEEYLGVRLLAIKGNHLTFGGKRKIEVRW